MSPDLDRETAATIEAFARCIRNAGLDMDADLLARELMAIARGRGWRPTEARVIPGWRHPAPRSAEPPPEWRQARAALEEKLHRPEGDVA